MRPKVMRGALPDLYLPESIMTYPSLTYLYPPYLSFYYLNLPQPNIFCLSFTLTELLLTCTVYNTICAHLYRSLYLTEYILTWIYPTWISPTWIYPNRVFSTWICPTWSSPYPCKSLNKLSLPESIPYRFQFQFQSLLEMNSDPVTGAARHKCPLAKNRYYHNFQLPHCSRNTKFLQIWCRVCPFSCRSVSNCQFGWSGVSWVPSRH
jgi:hypothetical protein